MGRRRNNILSNETLSQETLAVQEKILEEILEPNNSQDNQDNPGKTEEKEMNNLSIEEIKKTEDKPVKKPETPAFKPGDFVRLKPDVKFDMVGRRIHAGLKGYQYRVLSVRIDGMLIIECLTHCFTVEPKMVNKI